MFNFTISDIIELLYRIPCVLIALIFHEVAHGWMAYKLGDPTARNMGRLSLNPLKHLDPIGTLCMVFFRFGWAKPVPVNMRHFKKPRRDMAIVALAGPVMNLILSFIGAFLYVFIWNFVIMKDQNTAMYFFGEINGISDLPIQTSFMFNLKIASLELVGAFHVLNLSLAIFNLIPINPLDGSRILHILLPPKAYYWLMQHERYIMIGLMVLLWTGVLTKPLSIAVSWLSDGMINLINLIPFFG